MALVKTLAFKEATKDESTVVRILANALTSEREGGSARGSVGPRIHILRALLATGARRRLRSSLRSARVRSFPASLAAGGPIVTAVLRMSPCGPVGAQTNPILIRKGRDGRDASSRSLHALREQGEERRAVEWKGSNTAAAGLNARVSRAGG